MTNSDTISAPDPKGKTIQPLRLDGITKNFGGIVAIKHFDLEAEAGEIIALVGDNGAGKSTLVKIISGLYQPTDGDIWLNGQKTSFRDASDARTKGVEVVYQDLALVDLQPVYMNLFLGRELRKKPFGTLDRKLMATRTQALVDELDVRIPAANGRVSRSPALLTGPAVWCSWMSRQLHWALPRRRRLRRQSSSSRREALPCSSSVTIWSRCSASRIGSPFPGAGLRWRPRRSPTRPTMNW